MGNRKYSVGLPLFLIYIAILLLAFNVGVKAAPQSFLPVVLTQPDGTEIQCFASGDEFLNYYHDADENLIIKNPDTGYYTYVKITENTPVSNNVIVSGKGENGKNNQIETNYAKIEDLRGITRDSADYRLKSNAPSPAVLTETTVFAGNINNIVIFIRFSDEAEFINADNFNKMNNVFNNGVSQTVHKLDTGNALQYNSSVKGYLSAISNHVINLSSSFYPSNINNIAVSVKADNPRSYYLEWSLNNPNGYISDTQSYEREQQLIAEILKKARTSIPAGFNIDSNNDGLADSVTFVISGQSEGWSGILWPHQWSLYYEDVYINNKRVYDFSFIMYDSIINNYGTYIGTICHETLHVFGFPDLYDYSDQKNIPVGRYDVMANQTQIPMHPTVYTKNRWGLINNETSWVMGQVSDAAYSGAYNICDSTGSSGYVAIRIPRAITGNGKDIYIEYRRDVNKTGDKYSLVNYRTAFYENIAYYIGMPKEGLLIYAADDSKEGNYNNEYWGYGYAVEVLRTTDIKTQPLAITENVSFTYNNKSFLITDIMRNADGTVTFNLEFDGLDPLFVPVVEIEGVPETIAVRTPVELSGAVKPVLATKRTIVWSVKDPGTTGATLNGNILYADAAGNVTVTARIIGGQADGSDFVRDFVITVRSAVISGRVACYNPLIEPIITITNGDDIYTAICEPPAESSLLREFTITGVPDGIYDMVIAKTGHLGVTIKGIVVSGSDIDLTQHGNASISLIELPAGDVNSDGCIDLQDVILLTSSNTFSRSYETAINRTADINGDRCFDLQDLIIITSLKNYNKNNIVIIY
ncbi:MAG: hypothetical protein PHZ09_09505 [Eubacteriales bacterium]|nr:hypothetical protein [Eubacteriales bacterium]